MISASNLFRPFILRFFFLYVLLFISSFSFPHAILPDPGKWLSPFYEILVRFTGEHIIRIERPYASELISDSTGFYIHALNLIFISGTAALIWLLIDRKKKQDAVLLQSLLTLARYYLAMQLLYYGFNKLFKWQFYLPEPNTLFTSIGETHRDMLYWTSMGSSYSYSFFSGAIELIAAGLLFFRRTQVLGALLSLGIMINVLMINIGFDITVKLYSSFLILLCLIILAPDFRRLSVFFFRNKPVPANHHPSVFANEKYRWLYRSIKTVCLVLLLADSLDIYFESRNFNDDQAGRPPLHGAYEVSSFVLSGDTIEANTENTERWKRVFVHRRDYFIIQNMQDQMQDYILEHDTISKTLIMADYSGTDRNYFRYTSGNEKNLFLSGKIGNRNAELILKKIELEKLPLFENEFSWTVDE